MNYFKQQYPALCAPLHVRGVTLRNRMCSAPMGFPDLTEDGCLTEGAIAFYEERAKGGAAVVTVSEACVDYKNGKGHGRLINLQNGGVLAGLTNVARAIKRHGALANIELNHSGMLSDFDVMAAERAAEQVRFGPSDMLLPNGTKVKAMSREQIAEAVELFGKGAALVKRAGFDMIMLHAGHGWLVHQFLSPLTNKREDEYGGSFENRARLALEILSAMRKAVGNMPIEIRLSGMELAQGGIGLEDAVRFAKLVEKEVDIIHVSAGGEPDFTVTHPSMFAEPGCNVKYAAEIKKHVSVPVATLGALNEPEQMEEIISSGKADMVCMARALLADPQLPKKVEQNRTDEILRCMRCLVCHAERMLTQTRVCAINPVIGREYELRFIPRAEKSKRVLIAGGGPGGMQCAVTAAMRGHKVTLCEKSAELGGTLRCESNVPFKKAFPKYIATMKRRMELAGVEVRLNTAVTPEYVRDFAPDALIVAVGGEPVRPPIKGMDRDNVIFAVELHERENELGKRVAVIGGGLAGCETGLHLAKGGREVSIVEMNSLLAPDANPRHRPALMAELAAHTRCFTDMQAVEINEKGLLCKNAEGELQLIEADSILAAAGVKPRRELADSLRGTAPQVDVIGDCDRPGMIRNATFRAFHAALDL